MNTCRLFAALKKTQFSKMAETQALYLALKNTPTPLGPP
jgi:hypothetical protein